MKQIRKKKHPIFNGFKAFLRLFKKKPKMVYLGKQPKEPCIILSNHVGSSGPITYELHADFQFRFWGTYEMNGDFKTLYKYLSKDFYHAKLHMPLWLSRIWCVIAAPVAHGFYKGLELISTYKDTRFWGTMKESLATLQDGKSLIIFPEDSTHGYYDNLQFFFSGFTLLAKACVQKDLDVPIYFAYYSKKHKTIMFDKPTTCSELLNSAPTKEEIAENTRVRINALGEEINKKAEEELHAKKKK